jgi:hypothetical protein
MLATSLLTPLLPELGLLYPIGPKGDKPSFVRGRVCPRRGIVVTVTPGELWMMGVMMIVLGGRLVVSGVIYWSRCVEGSVVVCRVYISC